MLFNSIQYLGFLPLIVVLFWLAPKAWKTPLLLVASYIFYMCWKPAYILLIVSLTLINYFAGRLLERTSKKRLVFHLALVLNLLHLAFFKYAYFIVDCLNHIFTCLSQGHFKLAAIPFEIILPLGISFFVFEFIHYLADVYKGQPAIKSLWQFALFAAFFPTQIAGPIKRYQDFVPQLKYTEKLNWTRVEEGLELILFGLFKKVVLADNLATVVNASFAHHDLISGMDAWLAAYAFAFQIYFDFSGYTDIARGSAHLLGFKVPPNFDLPYLSASVSEFWHRWHISLSTWLRDYVFIPLGGSRKGTVLTKVNLLITLTIGGLWHGASMHFVCWGIFHGLLLVGDKTWQSIAEKLSTAYPSLASARQSKPYKILSVIGTFQMITLGLVIFRAENMFVASNMLSKMLSIQGLCPITLPNTGPQVIFLLLPILIVLLAGGQLIGLKQREQKGFPGILSCGVGQKALILKVGYLTALICLITVFAPDTTPKFYYFQF